MIVWAAWLKASVSCAVSVLVLTVPLPAAAMASSGPSNAGSVPIATASTVAPEVCTAATACSSVVVPPSFWPSLRSTTERTPVEPRDSTDSLVAS